MEARSDACERALRTCARDWSALRRLTTPVVLKRRAMASVTGASRMTIGLAETATAARVRARRAERRAIASAERDSDDTGEGEDERAPGPWRQQGVERPLYLF